MEVNGQVLSQGGDISADQVQDTTATSIARSLPGLFSRLGRTMRLTCVCFSAVTVPLEASELEGCSI